MSWPDEGNQGEHRHHGDILEQQDGEGTPTIGALQRATFFEKLQGNGRRGEGERDACDKRTAARLQYSEQTLTPKDLPKFDAVKATLAKLN